MEQQEEEQRQLKKAQRDVFSALDKYDSVRQSASAAVGEKIARMIELGESKKSAAELTGISSRDVSAFLADFEASKPPARDEKTAHNGYGSDSFSGDRS